MVFFSSCVDCLIEYLVKLNNYILRYIEDNRILYEEYKLKQAKTENPVYKNFFNGLSFLKF